MRGCGAYCLAQRHINMWQMREPGTQPVTFACKSNTFQTHPPHVVYYTEQGPQEAEERVVPGDQNEN